MPTPGSRPGGTLSQQLTVAVTLQSIDPKTPSVTVKTDTVRIMSFRVQDAKNLEGYKVGDTVEITYTQALAISVEPAKKLPRFGMFPVHPDGGPSWKIRGAIVLLLPRRG